MSTIKTTYLQHPSSGSPNLTLAADGSVSGGAGLGGLVHIATESVSAGSGISFDNVFSASYSAYRIVVRANQILTARLRNNGTDDTGTNYIRQYINGTSSSVTAGRHTATSWDFGGSSGDKFVVVDLYEPAASVITIGMGHIAGYPSSALEIAVASYYHTQASGYDGISLLGTSITATASIYGYAQ